MSKPLDCVTALKALGDPTRYEMVRLLLAGARTVNELAEELGTAQYNVSKHLRILREAGIITSERAGKEVRCEVAREFRAKTRSGGGAVDLGCCRFQFDPPEA